MDLHSDTIIFYSIYRSLTSWADPEGGGGEQGSGPPLKNHKNIGILSNIDPDPLKITKLTSQHSMVGDYRHASEMPF